MNDTTRYVVRRGGCLVRRPTGSDRDFFHESGPFVQVGCVVAADQLAVADAIALARVVIEYDRKTGCSGGISIEKVCPACRGSETVEDNDRCQYWCGSCSQGAISRPRPAGPNFGWAIDQGWAARCLGRPVTDCPYPSDTPEYVNWQFGYTDEIFTDTTLNPEGEPHE